MSTKNVRGCKVDFTSGTIRMNYSFASQAEIYGTAEYKLLTKIKADFPDFSVTRVKGRNVKTPAKNKRLTYENMKKYMSVFENAEELLARFNEVKTLSLVCVSPYKYVTDWFVAQFPNYDVVPEVLDKSKLIKVIEMPKIDLYEKKSA